MYQATVYQYNQRAEVLVPQRRGTTYYGPDNHKPLVVYRGLNHDLIYLQRTLIANHNHYIIKPILLPLLIEQIKHRF